MTDEHHLLEEWKRLRSTDKVAATRLYKVIKKKQYKRRKQAAKAKLRATPLQTTRNSSPAPPPVKEDDQETEYVTPTIEKQLEALTETLRIARGLPKEVVKKKSHEGDSSSASSTDSDAGEDDDEDGGKNGVLSEFEEIFRRHQQLAERAVGKTLGYGEEEDEGGDFLEERNESDEQKALRMRLEEKADQKPQRVDMSSPETLPKKKLKELMRPAVSELKMACPRPDVVDVWDATAPDPFLLVWLKGYRNTVKVPIHWNQKRKYLSGKRAIEKPPFKLPEYVEQTKIGEIRAAILERESQKSLKQKQREKSRPKSNRMHVDFQTLHDAFFKYATKPELKPFGELYYEGKEREEKTKQFKPGQLSSKLKEAVGIVLATTPTPWLITMQRYGPPPNYPNLKIPGLNAPLPVGAQWGFHAGGWGKPPSDHFGNPLYPEVFAEPTPPVSEIASEDPGLIQFWGELAEGVNVEEDDEDEQDQDNEEPDQRENDDDIIESHLDIHATGIIPAATDISLSESGIQSVVSTGFVTPSAESTRALLGGTAVLPSPSPTAAPLPPQVAGPSTPSVASPNLFPISHQNYLIPTQTILPGGLSTPVVGGLITPTHLVGGVLTPSQLIQPVENSEFSPDGIKEQLKIHEAADQKIRNADEEERKKKAEEAAKRKKRSTFKF